VECINSVLCVWGKERLIKVGTVGCWRWRFERGAGSHGDLFEVRGEGAGVWDTLPARGRWDFLPLWGLMVYFVYAMRRVECPRCGVWWSGFVGGGKGRLTAAYGLVSGAVGERLSWKDSSGGVSHELAPGVPLGGVGGGNGAGRSLDLEGNTASGWTKCSVGRRGHRYVTVVYQLTRE
jgi:hypothetical protein